MPSEIQHRTQARKNNEVWQFLKASRPKTHDWIVTIAFYEALHLVEAYLKFSGDQNERCDHGTRDQLLKLHHDRIYKNYRKLFDASLWARYLSNDHVDAANINPHVNDDIVLLATDKWLHSIKNICRVQIGEPAVPTPVFVAAPGTKPV